MATSSIQTKGVFFTGASSCAWRHLFHMLLYFYFRCLLLFSNLQVVLQCLSMYWSSNVALSSDIMFTHPILLGRELAYILAANDDGVPNIATAFFIKPGRSWGSHMKINIYLKQVSCISYPCLSTLAGSIVKTQKALCYMLLRLLK